MIVTKAIESYENIHSLAFDLQNKVTYSVKTKMNVQKYNENKLKAKKHIIFRYHLTSKMKRRNYECIKLKGIITFQWLRKMQMKIIIL